MKKLLLLQQKVGLSFIAPQTTNKKIWPQFFAHHPSFVFVIFRIIMTQEQIDTFHHFLMQFYKTMEHNLPIIGTEYFDFRRLQNGIFHFFHFI